MAWLGETTKAEDHSPAFCIPTARPSAHGDAQGCGDDDEDLVDGVELGEHESLSW